MGNFKIGEKVVRVWTNEIHTVTDIIYCPCCGQQQLNVDNAQSYFAHFSKPYYHQNERILTNSRLDYIQAKAFRKLDTQFAEDVCAKLNEEYSTMTADCYGRYIEEYCLELTSKK